MTNRATPTVRAFIVLPSLKVSGGNIEALKLGRDLQQAGLLPGLINMWRSPAAIRQDDLPEHHLCRWQTRAWSALPQLPWIAWAFRSWVARQQRTTSPAPLWIFTHYATLPLALLVPRSQRLVFVQDLEWEFLGEGPAGRLLRAVMLWIYRGARLLAANDYLAQALVAQGLEPPVTASIWPDPTFLLPAQDQTPRDLDVLMILRKGAHKRLDLYLQAIAWFRQHAPLLKLGVITTEDDIGAQVRDQVACCEVRPGGPAEMQQLYARAKVLFHLSEHEGFALPPLEAMGAGCIPFCRDSGGPRAYMTDEFEALLRPLDVPVAQLCAELVDLLNDEARAARHRDTARRLFEAGLARAARRPKLLATLLMEPRTP